jgi:hypothetical protein
MPIPDSCLTNVNAWSAYFIASHSDVDCGSPDSPTSPGATFLTDVRDATVEYITTAIDDDDLLTVSERIVENFGSGHYPAPIATVDVWRTFVDLAGWSEDFSSVGQDTVATDDLSDVAGLALDLIGDRVRDAVALEVQIELTDRVEVADDLLRTLGQENGQVAAGRWAQEVIGGRSTGDTLEVARTVLRGIDDGDPEMMSSLASADLSGEMADGITIVDLLRHVDLDGLDPACHLAQELADVYVDAFNMAAATAVEEACREALDVD